MNIRNVSWRELQDALAKVNEKYEDNVIFNRCDASGRAYLVTLRVKDSKKAGHRLGFTGRRMVSACWHVHGDFFDALLSIQPEAVIKTAHTTITQDGGNWEDWNIGSMMERLYYSEACECQ